ncbi:hypothetical protein FHX08_000275 [Rhizobium sp. BK529]|uniref:hypothetical protein n=1 Tax=Rhizobium sp. BK529 TaxID=2586983 RepID=UPI00160F9FDB|nr:hypothetical protein [Rhizobium sp. BK529]MBB3589931.1 hypothetical protein [Rhizobium sp. BK529]
MQLIDPNHPAYRHLWVRILIVAVCFGWAGLEFIGGDPFWGVLAGAVGAYAFYMLIWTFDPKPPEPAPAVVIDEDEEDADEPATKEEKKAE